MNRLIIYLTEVFRRLPASVRRGIKYSPIMYYLTKLWLVPVETTLGLKLLVPPDRKSVYEEGYELMCSKKILDLLDDESVFFDIGCNLGYYSFLAYEEEDVSEVYSFDPAYRRGINFQINNRIVAGNELNFVDAAVGDGEGEDSLSLDSYCEKTGKIPDIIKIDIEGLEYEAIQGMKRILEIERPHVLVEIHTEKLKNKGLEPAENRVHDFQRL